MKGVVGRIMAPQNVRILILGVRKYFTLLGKMDFACVTKLRALRWGDDPG